MLFSNWPSSLKYHLLLRRNARARRGRRRTRSTLELMQLEDLCLLSAFVPTFPTNPTTGLPMGTMQSQGLTSVLPGAFTQFPVNQGTVNPNLPAAKLITIMNNSSDVIFPILYGSNSTADNTAGQVVRVLASGGSGYSGTFNVTFKLGSGPGAVAATAVVAGNGAFTASTSSMEGRDIRRVTTYRSTLLLRLAAPPSGPARLSRRFSVRQSQTRACTIPWIR